MQDKFYDPNNKNKSNELKVDTGSQIRTIHVAPSQGQWWSKFTFSFSFMRMELTDKPYSPILSTHLLQIEQ